MQADDPPFLPVGTDVSAKYKGAFCEAKIKKVVRNIKCKVTFKGVGAGSTTVSDDAIKGTLRVGNTVEVKLDQRKELLEALITKIQDCSQYTVVFDDGDITTLRRSALCLKSGRHFAESETLDQLPLTHPEHFGNPVIGSSGRRGRRTNRTQSDDSDSDASESTGTGTGIGSAVIEREPHAGRVVLVQCSTADKKRGHHSHQWFPGLVVAPNAQETVKIKVKDDYLVRSFKDGRYYTVPKKEAREFRRNSASTEWGGMEAALLYMDQGVLPTHWDKDILFGQESHSQSDEADSDDSMDDEPHEEKDHFVAQLYKFMDDRGTPLNRQPTITNKDVDLYRLFNVVQKLGGYNRVTNQNKWKRIALRLGFQPASTNVTNLCRQAYKKYLHSFEDFYRKLGVTLLSTPRGGRTTGRSLIRDRDKMHSSFSQKSASPAPVSSGSDEKLAESTSGKVSSVKVKEVEKETKKEKEIKVKEIDTKEVKDKDVKNAVKDKEVKEKDAKEVKEKEIKIQDKEKDTKSREKSKEVKEKESKDKDVKEKLKDRDVSHKTKQKEIKIKSEPVVSSEEDSGDNQPLVPVSIKVEKIESMPPSEKIVEKPKVTDTPKTSKLFKSASGTIDVKRTEKSSTKKITQRRNSLPRCNPSGNKSDSNTSSKEGRSKSSLSDTPATTKKQLSDSDKVKDKESSSVSSSAKKHTSSSDKNDSDSSSRGSKNGKISSRRNLPSNESTPPSTPSSSNAQSNKKPRKRKIIDTLNVNDTSSPQLISADIGDKLKVYYGPTHPESKVTYEAKVIEIDGKGSEALLRVHYTGWNTRYDEWIKPSRIAENLTQHSKNKHKDKGKRSVASSGSGSSDSNTSKKSRTSQSPSVPPSVATPKPHTRNRGVSSNPTANQSATDIVQSDSDSDDESDSSSQRQLKKTVDENKGSSIDKVRTPELSPSLIEKVSETPKEKSKVSKIIKTPQIKRIAEGSQSRVKRTRLKAEDNLSPRGRDYDLNEIRSELKGLEPALKTPAKDSAKGETPSQPIVEDTKISYKTEKPEKTPEKVTEDIYEFKEPEPFEFEARKSEEKKKRPTHRIFDEIATPSNIPQLKLSPSTSPDKPQEAEKVVTKSRFDSTFDKLCQDNYEIITETSSLEKGGESLSMFGEMTGEDSGDRLLMETEPFSQEPIFSYEPELFPDKAYTPIFKGFTPAKNQETYSKKDAASKLQDIDDDFTNSPIKGEQSSDEDPIDAAIQRVNAHSMSDDSNDGELLIKTPATPTVPTGGLLASFSSEPPDIVETELTKPEKTDTIPKSKLEGLLKLKPEILHPKPIESDPPKSEKQEPLVDLKNPDTKTTAMEACDTHLDNKIESDTTSSFADVIMPEPPAGFLIHKEGPSIADKVLRALSSSKKGVALSTPKDIPKVLKPDPIKVPKSISPKNLNLKLLIQKPIIVEQTHEAGTSTSSSVAETAVIPETKIEESPINPKTEPAKKDVPIISETANKSESVVPAKPELSAIASIKKESTERRKSIAETPLGGKNNRVLSETIQKLSSQISQPTPSIPLPEYQTDDRSDTTDSDDSDRRLIIDKLSEEESQSQSHSENSMSQLSKAAVDKSNVQWSNIDSNQDTDNEKSSNVPDLSVKEPVTKPLEEDSNISLLLCEETIPGSPAPESLGEAAKNVQSKARTRNLDIPFASVPSTSPDDAPKESPAQKDPPREKDAPKECREPDAGLRNERGSRDGNNSPAETVMDNTPPTTPESSLGNISPARDQHLSDTENVCDVKINEDNSRILAPSKKINEIDKGMNIRNSGLNSPGVGPRRGRRPRGCRLSDSEDQNIGLTHSNAHRPLKYNFFVDLDPMLDGTARIALITSRLSELRKVYHTLKAELATIDRRRKKLRRKEREAIKAAKAACS